MNELEWGVEHHWPTGAVAYRAPYPDEAEARRVAAQCNQEGRDCRVQCREVGPWESVPNEVVA